MSWWENCSEILLHNMTVQDMKQLVEDKLDKMYIPRFIRRFFIDGISQLKRWKNTSKNS